MQTIDIRTTQNVVIEYELAPLRERIFAFFIDIAILLAFYLFFFLAIITPLLRSIEGSPMFGAIISLAFVGGFMLYHLLSEVLADGQSWGKRSMGIKVVRLDGQEPGLTDYLLRAVFHVADTLFSGGILAILLILSSDKNQRLGDMTAGTTVIRVRHNLRFRLDDILNINTLENYEPQYPEVRQLSEQDMLLIKNVVSRYRMYKNDAHREVINKLVAHLTELLALPEQPRDKIGFLQTLIRDYIVITR
ncbi:MAG: RDD family protein [Phaeodactylibacter sp.]|nr:RDD family protein [Phaeodactylibacter sp.]MCB9275144.1 RDD family protein [Lewinellaceae bacterium]